MVQEEPVEAELSSNDAMIVLRSMLAAPPSDGLWDKLLDTLVQWRDAPDFEMRLQYIDSHLASWPAHLRASYDYEPTHPGWPLVRYLMAHDDDEAACSVWEESALAHITGLSTFANQLSPKRLSLFPALETLDVLMAHQDHFLGFLPPNIRGIALCDFSLKPEALVSLTHLEHLTLWGNAGLQELDLRGFGALRSLQVHLCSGLTTLWLPDASPLETLSVRHCEALTSIHYEPSSASVSPATHLSTIALAHCPQLDTFSSFHSLGRLRSLEAEHCGAFLESEPLKRLKSLERLSLSYAPVMHIDLRMCSQLRVLGLLHLAQESLVSGLDTLPKLHTLSLSALPSLLGFGLSPEARLEALTLEGWRVEDLRRDAPYWGQLTTLHLSGCQGDWVTHLALPSLQTLILERSGQSRLICDKNAGLSALKHIELSESYQLQKLHLEGLEALEVIEVASLSQLQTLTLQELPVLTKLSLQHCLSLKHIQVSALACVEVLDVSGCAALSSEARLSLEALTAEALAPEKGSDDG